MVGGGLPPSSKPQTAKEEDSWSSPPHRAQPRGPPGHYTLPGHLPQVSICRFSSAVHHQSINPCSLQPAPLYISLPHVLFP